MSKYYDSKQLPKETINILYGVMRTGKTYYENKKLKKIKVIRKFGDSNE